MACLDLKEAYFSVPIHKRHRKFLRFIFDNTTYEFCCLPFGLSIAPWVFTKLMKPVVSLLREQGQLSVIYLDDLFLIGSTFNECLENIQKTKQLLERLGFIINKIKSQLIPKKECKFLGFLFNSVNMVIKLPTEKREKIYQMLEKFSNTNNCRIRDFAHFVGVLVSASPEIKFSPVYLKRFEREKYLALKNTGGDFDKNMIVSSYLAEDFIWWKANILSSYNLIR